MQKITCLSNQIVAYFDIAPLNLNQLSNKQQNYNNFLCQLNMAYEALLAILNKANDSTKVSYYTRGLNQLIIYFLNHKIKKDQGFQLMLYFVSKFYEFQQI
ncbi:unnamed protein product [Paramecium sonneborni]|uniref:Uncharacterized protein n=1 Tax=Paramecium sonneborni TaxID=65129 RepID=A0A8S1LX35_9CILI|nr:unnamed protein product [Paramecium sonneborni]